MNRTLSQNLGRNSRRASIVVTPTAAITRPVWDELWSLAQSFFDTQRGQFEARLKQHQRIGLFRSQADGVLVGMASIDVHPAVFRGRRIAVISTSHVVLQDAYRGRNLVQKLGLRIFVETRLRHPLRPIYWFFVTFSYKSYLLLPRNFRVFWPRFDGETPEWEQALMDQLARQIYGRAWRPAEGIVAASGEKRLRPEVAPLYWHVGNPDLAFFAYANPRSAEGDMLVCLCPLTLVNWLSVGVRAFHRARRSARLLGA